MVHTPQPSSTLCQFIDWHIWACDKYYNRPVATSASTRLGHLVASFPAALLLEGDLWEGKGVIRILNNLRQKRRSRKRAPRRA